jgi:hypothetical protein
MLEISFMNSYAFWSLIGRACQSDAESSEQLEAALAALLQPLSVADLTAFAFHFDDVMDRAYRWDLWGAAYLIGGGCSDDAFSDFRGSLIARGRTAYEQAVTDPDSLADAELDEDAWFHEGFGYLASAEFERRKLKAPPRAKPHPVEPEGQECSEDDLQSRFPRLSRKYA